ncbi:MULTISPECIES: aminotransferase class IV [Clostridium]|uniref:Aminotransferase class IV n=1 Tax=Clostridium cibarium TaxID=2762247 RepID=A0ABR8PNX7_9CLOT|nr:MULTISPECIES: aminotransferase class IV [Clostridium]MBD7909876.1 aminotransferase class IV [Clostridium cibarium]
MEVTKEFFIEGKQIKTVDEWIDEESKGLIYEVIRIINCKPLFYEEHYRRMVNSCRLAEGNLYVEELELRELIRKLVDVNKAQEGNVKVTYNMKSGNVRLFFIPHSYPTNKMYRIGVETILYYGERDNPNAKIINNSFREKVNTEIKKKNAYEAILVDRNNLITEGSRSNIFLIKNSCLYTSKVESVLPGVTRTEIIKVAKKNGIEVFEENINAEKIGEFDAMFISGTSPNVLPINMVDDTKFNVNNELMRAIMALFLEEIESCVK